MRADAIVDLNRAPYIANGRTRGAAAGVPGLGGEVPGEITIVACGAKAAVGVGCRRACHIWKKKAGQVQHVESIRGQDEHLCHLRLCFLLTTVAMLAASMKTVTYCRKCSARPPC